MWKKNTAKEKKQNGFWFNQQPILLPVLPWLCAGLPSG
jgi:hypothetical protein